MKVLAAQPDAIVTGSYYADSTIIMREWFQTGQKTRWVIPGHATTPEFIKAVGPARGRRSDGRPRRRQGLAVLRAL